MALFFTPAAAGPSTAGIEGLLRKGAVDDALTAAAEAAKQAPDDLDVQEIYVDLLLSTGRTSVALQGARARAQAQPLDPAAHYLLGRATPDASDAQSAYENALKLDPTFARAYMGMGAIHEARGRLIDAEAAYRHATEGDAQLSEAWLGEVRMLLRLSRREEATAAAKRGLTACPNEPALALVLADLTPDGSEALLTAAIGRTPDEPRLHEALAARLLARGDSKGALAAASRALAIDPSAAKATRTALFAREIAEGRLDLAGMNEIDSMRILEVLDPKAAVAKYPPLLQRYPRSAMVRIASSAARKATGDPGALDDIVDAASLDPTNAEASGAAGFALLEAKRPAEAEPLLSRASAARPWDPSLAIARVRALAEIGRSEEAARLAAETAARFRFDASAQLTHAGFLLDAKRPEEAYTVVRNALLATPDPRLAAAFVRIAPLAGHPEEAARILDKIVAVTGNPALAEAARKLREIPPR